jgi:hypothetical protein
MNKYPDTGPNGALPTHEEITRYAYKLWLKLGKPEGQADVIWLDAERRLLSECDVRAAEAAAASRVKFTKPTAEAKAGPGRLPSRSSSAK